MSFVLENQLRSLYQGGGGNSYSPHPAPDAPGNQESISKMAPLVSLLKNLVIPASISLALYILISYLLVPLWKRYRARYSTYLPLGGLTSQTESFRHRILGAIGSRLFPSTWQSYNGNNRVANGVDGDSGSNFEEEDGEELYEVDANRREALSLDSRRASAADDRRLGRDLEEGFRDDSESDNDDTGASSTRRVAGRS